MRKNSTYRKEIRRNMAKESRDKRDKITDQQQLDKLDGMFGKGIGATKERAKLQKRIENAKLEKVAKKTTKKAPKNAKVEEK